MSSAALVIPLTGQHVFGMLYGPCSGGSDESSVGNEVGGSVSVGSGATVAVSVEVGVGSGVAVGALVGRSASAVEGVCKRYPPELVKKVRELRQQGLSYAEIAQITGRAKTYIGWLAASELTEGNDKAHERDGEDLLPLPGAM